MIGITLRQIEIFLAVSRSMSMSKAAEDLNLTQSAVSMAINELEKYISDRLFDRSGKKLFLNGKGRALIPKAVAVYDMAREIEVGKWHESIKISASSTIGNYILPSKLGKYIKEHPETTISLSVKNTDEVVNEILNFQADIGFIEGPCTNNQIDIKLFTKDQLFVFCAPNSTLANEKNVTVEKLMNYRWILREKGSGTREVVEKALNDIFAHLNIYMELGHSEAIKNAVLADIGISCLSEVVLKNYIASGLLKTVDTNLDPIVRNLYIIMHKDKYLFDSLKNFLNYIQRS
ncbi:MAG: LysR family transcriptional regulator [Flexistipes sinusarabici]|uniref:LysR family transcriptional regulator n=1 Tax=Flexistipes sinusarabici TaxID=2352 RepID=A0A5D0MLI6_FLESI|nr:LysR family transcriptional regulator [Flexistipes sinusarabici]TYB33876.1 MAG: LysR family transcriptional regulator [Flexistipes sinusarabici]